MSVATLSVISPPTTCSELVAQLNAEGFVIGKPAHVTPSTIAIDRLNASESFCDECTHYGLDFIPFRPRDRKRQEYRCVAFCCLCETATEM